MYDLRTCRICGKQDTDLMKTGVRHYVHPRCWLRFRPHSHGLKVLDCLHAHQIRNFPILALSDWLKAGGFKANALDVAKAAIRRVARLERVS
jgi:hypothetical protein